MLTVALLGQLKVQLDGQPAELSLRPVQMLLAYLLLHRGAAHRRERLAGLLWPDYTEASARKNLRNTVYRLRKVIGDDYLLADRTTLAFNTAAPLELDVAQLEKETDPADVEALVQAVEAYQGELLPGFYEDWVLVGRERLRALFERRMQQLLEVLVAAGRWTEILTWAEHWIAQGGAPEPAYRALMRAHAGLGDLASMAHTYQRCVQLLDEELSLQPSTETKGLYRELQAVDAGAAPRLAEPVAGDAYGTTARARLPVSTTLFIGRERELAELQQLLGEAAGGRLVTIVGPGGIGKTRLALETARAMETGFPDGVFFVPLAPLTDTQQIVATISDGIGFRNTARGDPRQGLLNYLQHKQLLLVMDNFEHVLAGADMVTDILQYAPRVKILNTSRERLNLSGEAIYMLSGLDYPTDARLLNKEATQFGAVQLLLDRARLVRPALELDDLALTRVIRICRLVQGMPLALVLAAGWLELLTFEEVADEIAASLDILESQARDMPERQRSVRAAFEYSWQRLTAEDQQAFSRLAVFRGGFSRRAAQQVAGAGLRTLRTLLEKSFITAEGPDRYAVHELLRQFAEEKLEAAGQAGPIRDIHSHYYLAAVAQREDDLKGRRQLEALEEIGADLDNVRSAWAWALEQWDLRGIDRAQESIALFCYMRSRNQEGWIFFQQALQRLDSEDPTVDESPLDEWERLRGRLMARSGLLQSQFAKLAPEIEQTIKKSLAIAEANADQAEIAYSYLAIGHYHTRVTADFPRALDYFLQSLERYQALEDLYYVAHALHRVGYSHGFVTGLEEYMRYARQSLELARQIGDLFDEEYALLNLGGGHITSGDYARAEPYLREAKALGQQMGDRIALAHSMVQLGLCHLLYGRLEEAQEAATEGVVIAQDIVFTLTQAYGLAVLSVRASLDGDYELGRRLAGESQERSAIPTGNFLGHWAQATALIGLGQTEQAWQQARAALKIGYRWRMYGSVTWILPVVGVILARHGQPERAGEILSLYFNHPLRPTGWAEKWPLLGKWQARLENSLGSEGYQTAWERGRDLDLVATIEDYLDEENGGRDMTGAGQASE